jgi:RHS repeat-associated protein
MRSALNRTDDNGSSQFEWDHENRLRQADTRYGTTNYKYDALGRRVEQVADGSSTKFVYDGLDVVSDKLPDDSFVKYVNGPGIDNKLSYRQDGSDNYFLADHLGSTVGLADSSGNVTDLNSYDSFGNPTNTGFSSRYQFTGREYDSFTGLQFSRARFYDPNLGRFISEDPIGFYAGDVNLYGYVKNQSLQFRDPSGLQSGAGVINNPNTIREALQALAAGGGALLAAAASSPAVVAVGGLAAGAAIGYYPGQLTANSPSNPFVNGPWNPLGTPFPMLPPWTPTTVSGPKCEVRPRPIPWTRDQTPPWPTVPSDPGRYERCKDALAHCVASAGGDPITIGKCAASFNICITTNIPVFFPDGGVVY